MARGLKKGDVPQSYKEGKLQKKGFQNRTKEEMQEIVKKSLEARRENHKRKVALQETMRTLLSMKTNNRKQREILREYGFEDEELTNKTVLMVALYRKGLTGDVSAIREIIDMAEKLDLFDEGKRKANVPITINLVTRGEEHIITQEEQKEIWEAENSIYDTDEPDNGEWDTSQGDILEDDWGNDVYKP